jgi:hypothetical protein
MSRIAYRYVFSSTIEFAPVIAFLESALVAVESVHGYTKLRLDARFRDDPEKRVVVIDATTRIGDELNRIFTGYIRRWCGESGFTVKRCDEKELDSESKVQDQATAA